MITNETINELARRYQTSAFPNIVREYIQHLFLASLYVLPGAENLLFKGGTALRIVYGSPRFSESLDFSLFRIPPRDTKQFVEGLFIKVLAEIEHSGIKTDLHEKSRPTDGGYFGAANFSVDQFPPASVEINVSARNGKNLIGEVDSVANEFVPTYTLFHLPQDYIVEEKVFGALLERKKPRDFYDLYFMMRKGMVSPGNRARLADYTEKILTDARQINFDAELGAFLPASQHMIIRNFPQTLEQEMHRQISIS